MGNCASGEFRGCALSACPSPRVAQPVGGASIWEKKRASPTINKVGSVHHVVPNIISSVMAGCDESPHNILVMPASMKKGSRAEMKVWFATRTDEIATL